MSDAPDAGHQKIVIKKNGPYIVTGVAALSIQVITPNEDGVSWDWTEGAAFPTEATYKLCRCGQSQIKPFCDGTHKKVAFDGTETATRAPVARPLERYDGPPLPASIGVVEDPGLGCSGPLWVRGGITIESADGTRYEQCNRVTLCRCGASDNKPFCNGSHASIKFDDGLMGNAARPG